MYTVFIPRDRRQHSLGLHNLRNVYQQGAPSFLEIGKGPTVSGLDCTEDARICPNGIAHAARLVSDGQYADVICRATEQFHARICFFGKIDLTLDLIGLQETNNTSHLTVGGILNRYSCGHRYLCTKVTTWQSPKYYCMRQFSTLN